MATNGRVAFQVKKQGQPVLDCASLSGGLDAATFLKPPPSVLEGVVTDVSRIADAGSSAFSFTVDTGPPAADCPSDALVTFDVQGADAELPLSLESFVRIEYQIWNSFPWRRYACTAVLEVTSLPEWAGMTNPRGSDPTILLGLWDGGSPSTFVDSAYSVEAIALGCNADAGRGCGSPAADDYAFRFAPKAAPERRTVVYMGETRTVDVQPPGASGTTQATNLRSFQTVVCDDYWNLSYYLSWRP